MLAFLQHYKDLRGHDMRQDEIPFYYFFYITISYKNIVIKINIVERKISQLSQSFNESLLLEMLLFFCVFVCTHNIKTKQDNLNEKMNQMYTVEAIIGRRNRKGVVEYKVKWLGYDLEDCTWQPVKNLSYVKDMIRNYDKNHLGEQTNVDDNGLLESDHNQQIFDQYENEENNEMPDKFKYEEDTRNICFQESEQMNPAQNPSSEKNQKDSDYDNQIASLSFGEGQFDDEDKGQYPPSRKIQKNQPNSTKKKVIQKSGQKMSRQSKKSLEQPAEKVQKKSYLQQIQKKTRFIVRVPPKRLILQPQAPMLGQLNVLQISRCSRTNELIYLTQLGLVVSYRRQTDMKLHYPDELIKFYESRIEFSQIPKISR